MSRSCCCRSRCNASETLLSLVPIITGGGLTLIGGIIGSILSHRLKTSSERKELRRQKLEEVVAAVYGLEHWLELYGTHVLFDRKVLEEKSPLSKICALSGLCFPELKHGGRFDGSGWHVQKVAACHSQRKG